MRIGQRLALQTGMVFLASILTIAALGLNARRESLGVANIERLHEATQTLHSMQTMAYEMRYWNFERGRRQWAVQHAALERELEAFTALSDEGRSIHAALVEGVVDRLPRLVDDLQRSLGRAVPHAQDLVDIRLRRLLTAQAHLGNELYRLRADSTRRWQAGNRADHRLVQALVAAFILLSVLSGWWLFRSTVRPVLGLRRATRQLTQGDLSARAPVGGTDELGDLGRDFNRMAETLHATLASRADLEREIRGRKAMAVEREAALSELKRSNEELTRFAYVASHDLQEPLRVVSGFLELIDDTYRDKLDTKGREWIAFAVDGAQRMSGLIEDLLCYARITTRARPFTEVDLQDVMDAVREDLAESLAASGAALEVGDLPRVQADASQMYQLLQNLVGNGIKFTAPGRTPRVGVAAERLADGHDLAPGWRLSVTDNGIGIAQEYHERIFRVFQRLHTLEEYPGTGIGLAICRKIAERHGGLISVRSTPGAGTCFCVDLPDQPPGARLQEPPVTSEHETEDADD